MNNGIRRLFRQGYAYFLHLTTQRGCKFGDLHRGANYLWESTMYALQDAPSNIFENIAGHLNFLGNLLIDREVIDTFQQVILLGCIANLHLHFQINVIAVADHFFEVVAAVGSAKLHPFEFYNCSHIFILN